MDRRAFLGTVARGLLAAPLATEAQQAGNVYRVGLLGCVPTSDRPVAMTPFREALRALRYIEGQAVPFECRGGSPAGDRLADLAAELVRIKVAVIVTDGTALSLAAKQATNTIPIVMVYVAAPVGSGLVTSLARPEGNVTGLSEAHSWQGTKAVARRPQSLSWWSAPPG